MQSKEPIPEINTQIPSFSPTTRNLVFGGGGILGLGYLGVRAAMDECNFPLENIKRVGGTSAGAMNALALALGFTTTEMAHLLLTTNFQNLLDESTVPRKLFFSVDNSNNRFFQATTGAAVLAAGLPELTTNYGLYKGKFILDWFENIIYEKTHIHNCNFRQLYELSQQDSKFKQLAVVAVDTNLHKSIVFSYETTPDIKISFAVKASMTVPFIFWPEKAGNGNLLVDGGLLNNYPLDLFDNEKFLDSFNSVSDNPIINEETLGFNFDMSHTDLHLPTNNVLQYVGAITATLIANQFDLFQRREDLKRTVTIDPCGISPFAFDIDTQAKKRIIEAGWNSFCQKFQQSHELPSFLQNLPESDPAIPLDYSCIPNSCNIS